MKSAPCFSSLSRRDRPATLRWRVAGALLLAATACLPPAVAQSRTLAVSFVIPATATLTEAYPPERVQACAAEATRLLCHQGREFFPYLSWTPSTLAELSSQDVSLQITLVETLRPVGREVSLRFTGKVGAKSFNVTELPRELSILYEATNVDQPSHSPALLTERIRQLLLGDREQSGLFQNSVFRDALERKFLANIPLATALAPEDTVQQIILEMPWDLMRANSESVLRLSYKAHPPQKPEGLPVSIYMSPFEKTDAPPWRNKVGCLVKKFTYPPVQHTAWHDAIVESWRFHLPESVSLFMVSFKKDDTIGTNGALDEGEGGGL